MVSENPSSSNIQKIDLIYSLSVFAAWLFRYFDVPRRLGRDAQKGLQIFNAFL